MPKGVNRRFRKVINSPYMNDKFRMYVFKIKDCSIKIRHNWKFCPYAHTGEMVRRRDPRIFNYAAVYCPAFRTGNCPKGNSCEFAHGTFEFWLHPDKYRTRECRFGTGCRRMVCFFSHTTEQLRPVMKKKNRYVWGATMEGGKKDEGNGSVNMVIRDGNLKEEENLRRFKKEDDQDGKKRSFSSSDLANYPHSHLINDLVNFI
ncbi:hypothetical protein NE237_011988 [Protea cynaroides]|uniref:C3H1-type domain-containing protein n=1 Tax=Protea cynaroides TaxID=273540 RepID=A0A9Q0JYF2_9MAGN|nr:hypothetical protein NE237_011988 [Protea cynaroides]